MEVQVDRIVKEGHTHNGTNVQLNNALEIARLHAKVGRCSEPLQESLASTSSNGSGGNCNNENVKDQIIAQLIMRINNNDDNGDGWGWRRIWEQYKC